MLIAIPVFRVSAKVGIDRGRAWSVLDELILWAISQRSRSIAQLATEAGLHHRIVVASIARLMRFRLIELTVRANGAIFGASDYGREIVSTGQPLPFFPKRETKRVSFVIERATGGFFPLGQVKVVSESSLGAYGGETLRVLSVEGGAPSMTHEANFARLSQIAARGWEEQLALVDGRTASVRSEYMVVRVIDGVPRNVPDAASSTLRHIIDVAASQSNGVTQVPVTYGGPKPEPEEAPGNHYCDFDYRDLIIGGSVQAACLEEFLRVADRRAIIHSTFLDHKRFKELFPLIRAACMRGVVFDLLWGAEKIGEEETKNSAEAVEIAKLVRQDRDVGRRFHVHMRSTGSHAKLLLVDTSEGHWLAAVGSCNWLSSPFRSVELTACLRNPLVVADVVASVQRLVGRRGLSDDIANEMALIAKDLRRYPSTGGSARISLLLGDGHDVMMRNASGSAKHRLLVGCHRLGSTARPGVVMQGEAAADRSNVETTLLYTRTTGPLKNRHAKTLAEEAAKNGVRLVKTDEIPLHGKFAAWDEDDVAVTSLNWASAATDDDFPQSDIGVHISMKDLASHTIQRLESIFPKLTATPLNADSSEHAPTLPGGDSP